ncbi:MAG TPA: hypothetical protein PKX79_03375 [Spirochaetota bacterium]|jgi:predicted lipid-binding transport protein (Tim44 family)|nr:hypothetical protein [Spirochaetota bacterium]HOK01697.1 hypothetical protein [Spirochaetota bacterium]HOK91848.1 hypothetical protein [Spirochaetota bacterium]HON16596.1 hypothetical protein [Spirochaetota bacterium]HOQ12432.1 hypothetical protein [Spirochaetota bacterium]
MTNKMIGRIIGLLFFIIIGFVIWTILKLVFQLGRVSGEINRKFEEMENQKRKSSFKRGGVIEINKDDYKVE